MDTKCWHHSYMIFRISFINQKILIFFNIFQFLDTHNQQKDFFALLGQKWLTSITWKATWHVHLIPQKYFLEAYSTRCPPQSVDFGGTSNRKILKISVFGCFSVNLLEFGFWKYDLRKFGKLCNLLFLFFINL